MSAEASQPRSCEAGGGERDGKGRTRIPFRHAPVPGWACYATAWACRHSRSAFEARSMDTGCVDVFGLNRRLWRPLRGCVTTRPPTHVCTVAAWLASDLRHRRTACHLPRSPPPAAPGPRAASAPSSREVKGTARGTGAPVCAALRHGAGRARGRGIAPIMAPVSLPGLARGLHIMIIDRETFTELAVHLQLASDAILKTARHLTVLSNGDSSNEEQWAGTLDSLTAMNTEITVMEKILRALMEANREEGSTSLMVPDKQSEPLLS